MAVLTVSTLLVHPGENFRGEVFFKKGGVTAGRIWVFSIYIMILVFMISWIWYWWPVLYCVPFYPYKVENAVWMLCACRVERWVWWLTAEWVWSGWLNRQSGRLAGPTSRPTQLSIGPSSPHLGQDWLHLESYSIKASVCHDRAGEWQLKSSRDSITLSPTKPCSPLSYFAH